MDNYKPTPFKLLVEAKPVHLTLCNNDAKGTLCNCLEWNDDAEKWFCHALQVEINAHYDEDEYEFLLPRDPRCIERERYAALEAAGQMSLVKDVPGKVDEITSMLYSAFSHLLLAVIYDTLHHELNPSQLQLLHDGTLENAIARRLEAWKVVPGGKGEVENG